MKITNQISNNHRNIGSIYFQQLDILKGVAIISVILLHTIPRDYLVDIFAHFHIWQSVPIFFITLGITMGFSFSQRGGWELRTLLKTYYISRFGRLIAPFIIIFLISFAFGLYREDYYFGWLWIIGRLPVIGVGNYFASIMIQFFILSPFMYLLYKKYPQLSIFIFFLLELIFQLLSPHISVFQETKYLYSACILRYFSAIALGLHLSRELIIYRRINLFTKKNMFIIIGLPVSIAYLIMARSSAQPFPLFWDQSNFQNLLSFFYPAVLVVIFVNWNSKYFNKKVFTLIATIGKASYHIFLVQILFFGFGLSFIYYVNSENYLIWAPLAITLNLLICVSVGMLFYIAQTSIEKRFDKKPVTTESPVK